MTPAELAEWLDTEESRQAARSDGGGEPFEQELGRLSLEIKTKPVSQLTIDDYLHMRRIIECVHRHLVRRPDDAAGLAYWRHALMNCGHDPLK
ncbi:DNA-binding protein [Devosia pacifica]|uniref:DNA-binding protein n=2 Tax=Devosia pacifica TaxID=1335967 RepID=A0A918VQG2_9HYPH|nr:DNA-binding protein [Devosia pacifica]